MEHWLFNEFIAELAGTAILVFCGLNGCVCSYLSDEKTVLIPAFSFGLGVILALYLAGPLTGAHLNPAITIGFALIGKLSWRKAPLYIAGQLLGAFAASMLVYLLYIESFRSLGIGAILEIVLPRPAKGVTLLPALLSETTATALLAFAICLITDDSIYRSTNAHQIVTIGLVLMALTVAFFYNTGASMNPARDLGPRCFLALLGYYTVTFSSLDGKFWWAVGIFSPILGGVLGCLSSQALGKMRKRHLEERKQRVIPVVRGK